MSIQRCPRCGSNRIRQGYRRTPWWWAIFGRYNLLCDACNWEYVGFAVPGTVSAQSRKRRKSGKEIIQSRVPEKAAAPVAQTQEVSQTVKSKERADEVNQTVLENPSAEAILQSKESSAEISESVSRQSLTITEAGTEDKSDLASSNESEPVDQSANGTRSDHGFGNDRNHRPRVKQKKRVRLKIRK